MPAYLRQRTDQIRCEVTTLTVVYRDFWISLLFTGITLTSYNVGIDERLLKGEGMPVIWMLYGVRQIEWDTLDMKTVPTERRHALEHYGVAGFVTGTTPIGLTRKKGCPPNSNFQTGTKEMQ
ncbi:hypothetical protein CRG98_029454 [Punica granatum]|uniref:Uncharacterized protein n=1 Tax=Punica granatum TaxID=22663 RepID=A0A2I0J2K2_PUNGR|nr:hypothetical protein CRG98_029454 [Punica granatum]